MGEPARLRRGRDADLLPRGPDGLLLGSVGAVQVAAYRHGDIGRLLEVRVLVQLGRQRGVPDGSRLLPCVAADAHGGEVEGVVGDS